jgi:hypothetical protein
MELLAWKPMICGGRMFGKRLADSTAEVLTGSKFFPTQGIFAAACVNPRFVGE